MVEKTKRKVKNKVSHRDIESLVPFPTQEQDFPEECTKYEDDALAEDIRTNGLHHPIEILPENAAGLPANTIIAGHRRWQACRRLGVEQVRVLIRYDLMDAERAAIETVFIQDNSNRRQLSRLGKARVALRLFEKERGREPGELSEHEQCQARDRVGKAIGMSGRNLQRYWNVLRTPMSVQQAFEREEISLILAEKVSSLPSEIQQRIDKKILKGSDPKAAISQYVDSPKKKRGPAITGGIKALEKAMEVLEGVSLDDFTGTARPGELPLLYKANKKIVELIRKLKENRSRQGKALERAENFRLIG